LQNKFVFFFQDYIILQNNRYYFRIFRSFLLILQPIEAKNVCENSRAVK